MAHNVILRRVTNFIFLSIAENKRGDAGVEGGGIRRHTAHFVGQRYPASRAVRLVRTLRYANAAQVGDVVCDTVKKGRGDVFGIIGMAKEVIRLRVREEG